MAAPLTAGAGVGRRATVAHGNQRLCDPTADGRSVAVKF